MPAPGIDTSKPVFGGNAVDAELSQLRDNIVWLIIALGAAGIIVPGWDAAPNGADKSKPDDVVLTNDSGCKIRLTYSYTGDDVTGIDVDYDKNLGSGYEQINKGTATIAYDSDGNWTGTTWA